MTKRIDPLTVRIAVWLLAVLAALVFGSGCGPTIRHFQNMDGSLTTVIEPPTALEECLKQGATGMALLGGGGAAIGYGAGGHVTGGLLIGGGTGLVVGCLKGLSDADGRRPVIIHRPAPGVVPVPVPPPYSGAHPVPVPVPVPPPPVIYNQGPCGRYADPEVRAACERGAERAQRENQRERIREAERRAYERNRQGYGGYPGAEYYGGGYYGGSRYPSNGGISGSWGWGGGSIGPTPGSRDRY